MRATSRVIRAIRGGTDGPTFSTDGQYFSDYPAAFLSKDAPETAGWPGVDSCCLKSDDSKSRVSGEYPVTKKLRGSTGVRAYRRGIGSYKLVLISGFTSSYFSWS